ncbi:MAG: hypothetical protein ACOYJQ_06865 [Pseudochelatococcus sp.]|jgi:hypothetical protein|uniref:hypothetical protein n=1 Tax=Pseudochelatococcus sp. TaxID=2020869 RepID=UPI003D9091AE
MIIDQNEADDFHDVMEEKRAALFYVKEAFAEAQLDGLDEDCVAHAALFAAFHALVSTYGEEAVADFAERLPDRVRAGCFSSGPRH